MKLNNSQYDTIMRMYDAKQSHARAVLNSRYEEISVRIPEYDELRKETAAVAAEAARAAICGDMSKRDKLSQKLDSINEEKHILLTSAGYPQDYLDLHYDCPLCQDTGFVNGSKCRCFKQAAIDLLYNQSNIKKILLLENFSNFNYDWYSEDYIDPVSGISALENIVNVTKNVNSFLSDFPSGDNLLFYGDTGVGKTFLTHCIAGELLEKGYSVLYLSAIDLFDLFSKYAFDNDSEADYRDVFSQILDCELLIIDDLGTELVNSFTNSRLFYCINERILAGQSTIISTNLSLEELMNTYSERIFSRLTMSYQIFKIFGDDIRLKKL
jgi:DNA replication protein DnaC